jgi:hypothetical protein
MSQVCIDIVFICNAPYLDGEVCPTDGNIGAIRRPAYCMDYSPMKAIVVDMFACSSIPYYNVTVTPSGNALTIG